MARSCFMPHVPSTSVRVVVPRDVMELVDVVADRSGLARDDVVELALRVGLAEDKSSVAIDLWNAYRRGATRSPLDVAQALADAGIPDVVRGVRIRPTTSWTPDDFYDPVAIWPTARGAWRLRTDGVGVVVALHLGLPVAVYRVSDWVHDPDTRRNTAAAGHAITSTGRLLDVINGHDVGPASPVDTALRDIITTTPIVVPRGSAQPVVHLSTR